MSSTPEKIGRSLNSFEGDLLKIDESVTRLDEVSSDLFAALAETLARFDDVPVERLRKIRPLIEDVQEKRDDLLTAAKSIEDFKTSAKDLKSSVKHLKTYYDDTYMASVEARIHRDR